MKVTDTLTVELTYVHDIDDEDEIMSEEDYKNYFKLGLTLPADDAHIKKLKHFVNEEEK